MGESDRKSIEEKYSTIYTILESIAEGVFTVDLEFHIQFFNRAAEEITGIKKEEAIGQRCLEVLRTNVCENDCIVSKVFQTGEAIVDTPVYITRADRRRIPISVNTALLTNTEGGIVGAVEIFRDLTVIKRLRKALLQRHSFEDIITRNPKMLDTLSILPQIAESDSTVLIVGPSGTGKELLARAIHYHSSNKKGPFVPVNCGALPDTLIESELFGYKAGAFTDAKRDKPGRFAVAQNGSIFLDEIANTSPALQSRLLRVLENKTYEPLGSTQSLETNARVIAATNRDLKKLVGEGQFREDLYFRINVIKLSLPPLSERKEDIPLLVDSFIEHLNQVKGWKVSGISQEALAALMLYEWPGNVRELENAIEHAFVLCLGGLIKLENLPETIYPAYNPLSRTASLNLKEIEKHAIIQALERNNWKKMATARELGIDKTTLRRKMRRHGIDQHP